MAFPKHLTPDELVEIQKELTAAAQSIALIGARLSDANELTLLAHVRTASGKTHDAARHTAYTAQARFRRAAQETL